MRAGTRDGVSEPHERADRDGDEGRGKRRAKTVSLNTKATPEERRAATEGHWIPFMGVDEAVF